MEPGLGQRRSSASPAKSPYTRYRDRDRLGLRLGKQALTLYTTVDSHRHVDVVAPPYRILIDP